MTPRVFFCVFLLLPALEWRGGCEEWKKQQEDEWSSINLRKHSLWSTMGDNGIFFFFTAEQHAALIVVPSLHPVPAPKVLQLEQYNCHPSSQWSTETMPQSTWEGLEQNHSAWGTPGWQLQPPTQQAIQQRLSDRYEAVQAMSFPLLERARLWKSSLSAVDWAPQGQHSFSASWSTNGCLT